MKGFIKAILEGLPFFNGSARDIKQMRLDFENRQARMNAEHEHWVQQTLADQQATARRFDPFIAEIDAACENLGISLYPEGASGVVVELGNGVLLTTRVCHDLSLPAAGADDKK